MKVPENKTAGERVEPRMRMYRLTIHLRNNLTITCDREDEKAFSGLHESIEAWKSRRFFRRSKSTFVMTGTPLGVAVCLDDVVSFSLSTL